MRTRNHSRRRTPKHRAEARPQACSHHPRACIPLLLSVILGQFGLIDVPLRTMKISKLEEFGCPVVLG